VSILDQIQVTLRQPRWRRALAGAALSDGLSFAFALAPPFQLGIDLATAVLLLLLIGWRWGLAAALAVEAIPGLALFPAWTLAVLAYAAAEKKPQYPGLEP
jgi:MFS family permease